MIHGLTALLLCHAVNKREETEELLTAGRLLFVATRAAKGKNTKDGLRLDCFLNVIISHRESSTREEPESDLRMDRHYRRFYCANETNTNNNQTEE